MRRVLVSVAAIAALRFFLIPNFWIAAGTVASFWAWSYLQAQYPTHRRTITAVLAVALIIVVGPHLYRLFAPYNVLSHDAGKRRLWFWDLWRAEKMDPSVLKSRLELSEQLQWLEDRVGEEHEIKLAKIRADYAAHRITAEEAWHRTQKVQEESKRFQAKTDKTSRLITSGNTSEPVAGYDICPGAARQVYQLDSLRTVVTVPLNPDCWSGLIKLPADWYRDRAWSRWFMHSDVPGRVCLQFYDLQNTQVCLDKDDPGSTFIFPSTFFRVRGDGPSATFWLERK